MAWPWLTLIQFPGWVDYNQPSLYNVHILSEGSGTMGIQFKDGVLGRLHQFGFPRLSWYVQPPYDWHKPVYRKIVGSFKFTDYKSVLTPQPRLVWYQLECGHLETRPISVNPTTSIHCDDCRHGTTTKGSLFNWRCSRSDKQRKRSLIP